MELKEKAAVPGKLKNKIRIIGGQWRSRQLHFIDAPGLRPTPSRVRETLFNWLQDDIRGSRCLDLYAGSGALGFEAASRGAKSVVQVENNPQACRSLNENALALSASQIKIMQMETLRFLASDAEPVDIVFIDPPFGMNLVIETCHWLEDKCWLADPAKIYIETESTFKVENFPANWQLLKSKTAGEVGYHLFERIN